MGSARFAATATYLTPDEKWSRLETYGLFAESEKEVLIKFNGYVKSLLRRIENLEDYIKWQRDRVAKWKPEPLKPVEKVAGGFVLAMVDGSGYVGWTWNAGMRFKAEVTPDKSKAKTFTEIGAKQMMGKLRGYSTMKIEVM